MNGAVLTHLLRQNSPFYNMLDTISSPYFDMKLKNIDFFVSSYYNEKINSRQKQKERNGSHGQKAQKKIRTGERSKAS